MAWSGGEFEEPMPGTRTQTTSRNLLLQTYICAAELATWGVGPDVLKDHIDVLRLLLRLAHCTIVLFSSDFSSACHKKGGTCNPIHPIGNSLKKQKPRTKV